MKRIIVDIDNTLWDFGAVLWAHMRRLNSSVPEPMYWDKWDFWVEYLSEREFYSVVREIHINQNHQNFSPYAEARDFLISLKDLGFSVIIASHREKYTLNSTLNWLNTHELIYDEVHLENDKSILFENSYAVIDDSPALLEKAERLGKVRTGLSHPWNIESGHPLFVNLNEVYRYIRNIGK